MAVKGPTKYLHQFNSLRGQDLVLILCTMYLTAFLAGQYLSWRSYESVTTYLHNDRHQRAASSNARISVMGDRLIVFPASTEAPHNNLDALEKSGESRWGRIRGMSTIELSVEKKVTSCRCLTMRMLLTLSCSCRVWR